MSGATSLIQKPQAELNTSKPAKSRGKHLNADIKKTTQNATETLVNTVNEANLQKYSEIMQILPIGKLENG